MQEISTFISNHLALSIGALIVLLFIMGIELIRAKRGAIKISSARATQLINHDNAVVIDIRPTEAYRKGHIIDAQSITASEIINNSKKLEKFKSRPIILVCAAGIESQKIATLLLKRDYNVYSLSGGIRGWMDAQMPLVKE